MSIPREEGPNAFSKVENGTEAGIQIRGLVPVRRARDSQRLRSSKLTTTGSRILNFVIEPAVLCITDSIISSLPTECHVRAMSDGQFLSQPI